MPTLKEILDAHSGRVPHLREIAERCLAGERWGGSVVCMLVDAAITSTGVNYFTVVVPRVEEFRRRFVNRGRVTRLGELAAAELEELLELWGNTRSWMAAKQIAGVLEDIRRSSGGEDISALRRWAARARLEEWRRNSVGRIRGVGINTFQYLRMMGGVDTAMPDRIVKRFINSVLIQAGEAPVDDALAFIKKVEKIARETKRTAVELCFLAWLVQFEGEKIERYAEVLRRI
jgi:hypothetical protein